MHVDDTARMLRGSLSTPDIEMELTQAVPARYPPAGDRLGSETACHVLRRPDAPSGQVGRFVPLLVSRRNGR
ncbi:MULTISPECIES: hypothetical protein [unclassified Shinella]|uniref:hypothetical protein n=1 Tax=unclassified Shinella TaxID=2643062 RepID=UPI00225D6970|nr:MULTISPECIES: hypothetical protein [unclassified Shinella]MCO5139814.1 hypothetical protein [Shinella sp.]MDC7258549.1 hypothetical protein [Shinella sp. YE25]CAI0334889.1 conserved hypothetical protein [Rhizobiaceae bacterium]